MTGTPPENAPPPRPVIIQERSHPIRLKMIDRDATSVLRKLNKAGFSSYLVGGGVRDLYLGRAPKDFDISTDARPGQIRKIFPNSATIGRRFRLVQVFSPSGKIIEVSTLRSLSEHDLDGPQAVLAPNNTFGNLPEDAQRRDLSINSLFFELENKTIIDYVGGVDDLDNSIIRMVGEPDKRINRDPVRMMRAIRHSARIGFIIEEKTWRSICTNHHKLTLCPPSRIRDELFKDLYGGSSLQWFKLAMESEMFFSLFPFYKNVLFSPTHSGLSCLEQLSTIFSIFDKLQTSTGRRKTKMLPNYFILALILMPWADSTYDISRLQLKGPGVFQLSKKLRKEIDSMIGTQLNLRKSIRQEIVTLLTNLPQFVRFGQSNTWPKWLKKKSYFTKGLLFFDFFKEANTKQNNQSNVTKLINRVPQTERHNHGNTSTSRRKAKPAFSPKKQGGIFGLKK